MRGLEGKGILGIVGRDEKLALSKLQQNGSGSGEKACAEKMRAQ